MLFVRYGSSSNLSWLSVVSDEFFVSWGRQPGKSLTSTIENVANVTSALKLTTLIKF
jgi:hypothetical protein